MANFRVLDFFDGQQSAVVPDIGTILDSDVLATNTNNTLTGSNVKENVDQLDAKAEQNASDISDNDTDILDLQTNKADLVAGKVPVDQLPSSIMQYKSMWNASTNTPTLSDGAGNPDEAIGDVYKVSVGATIDLGSGNIDFVAGEYAILNDSKIWEKSSNPDAVTSVHGRTGIVTAQSGDYTADQITETATKYFAIKHNRTAIIPPTVNDDSSLNYSVGSEFFDSVAGIAYVCQDASVGAAVWIVSSGAGGSGVGSPDIYKIWNNEDDEIDNWTASGSSVKATETGAQLLNGTQSFKWTPSAASEHFTSPLFDVPLRSRRNDMTNRGVLPYHASHDGITIQALDSSDNVLGELQLEADSEKAEFLFDAFEANTQIKFRFLCETYTATMNIVFDDLFASDNSFLFKDLYQENTFSGKVQNNGTASIISQSTDEKGAQWIDSVTRNSVGDVTVNFVSGFFSVAPSVVALSFEGAAGNLSIQGDSVTTSGARIVCETLTEVFQDHDFDIIVQRQGSDYRQAASHVLTPTENVAPARYSRNQNGTLDHNTESYPNFDNKTFDDDGLVTTNFANDMVTVAANGWKWTASKSGKISVEAQVQINNGISWDASEYFDIRIKKNGSTYSESSWDNPSADNNVYRTFRHSDKVNVTKGDTIQISLFQNSGQNINIPSADTKSFVNIDYIDSKHVSATELKQETLDIDMNGKGAFTGGTLRIIRDYNQVTATLMNPTWAGSLSSIVASSVIPERFLPTEQFAIEMFGQRVGGGTPFINTMQIYNLTAGNKGRVDWGHVSPTNLITGVSTTPTSNTAISITWSMK
jgi:hypothetical protein